MLTGHRATHVKYLLIGAGLAGSAAAEAIRTRDPGGSLMLVGQEVNRPYHRPPLSKALLRGEIDKRDLVTQPVGWFPEHNVQLVTGRRVTQLDPSRHLAFFDDGTIVQYDQCLLSYGAMVAPLEVEGSGLPGVYYLRTLADAEALITRTKQALAEGRPHPRGRGRVAIIGGGLLGVEVAASLRQRGLWVELILQSERPWSHVAGEAAGRFCAALLESQEIVLHPKNPPKRLLGDGRVQRVELNDGSVVQCDFAIACVGMRVDRRLIQNTSIPLGRAITCDRYGRAGADQGVEHVWAAGDCAAVFDERFGKHVGGGHWDLARLTGQLAGENMARTAAGEELVGWSDIPGWHSEVFGRDIYAWGMERFVDRHLVRGSVKVDAPDFAEIGLDTDGRVCHVLAVGREQEHAPLRELVVNRMAVSGQEETIRDPDAALPRD